MAVGYSVWQYSFMKYKLATAVIILCLSTWFGVNYYKSWHEYDRIVFLDVGQGDAVLIRSRTGETMLIDGGPDDKVVYELGKYLPFWQRQIDYLVLSHPHADHLVGLIEILQRYKVKTALFNKVGYRSPFNEAWLEISQQFTTHESIQAGDLIDLGDSIQGEVLWPTADFINKGSVNVNELSNVLRFEIDGVSFLTAGDAEGTVEEWLLELDTYLDSDIFKVTHHGSIDSNRMDFLEEVIPELAIISVGLNNKFGHPSRTILKRLKSIGAEVYRTDRQGRVQIKIKDGHWLVNEFIEK